MRRGVLPALHALRVRPLALVAPRPCVRSLSLFREPTAPAHRSDAQVRVSEVPVIQVEGTVAVCDGGGGATGHPIEYINLDRREGNLPETCKYCGLRFQMASHHHDTAWSSSIDDLPAGRLASLPRPFEAVEEFEASHTAALFGDRVAATSPPEAPCAGAAVDAPVASPQYEDAPRTFKAGKRTLEVKGADVGPPRVSLELHLKDDRVTIVNVTGEDLPLRDWVLLSETGTQFYDFPKRLVLAPDSSVSIWSGKNSKKHHNPPHSYSWTRRFIWNDKGDKAILVDNNGYIAAQQEQTE